MSDDWDRDSFAAGFARRDEEFRGWPLPNKMKETDVPKAASKQATEDKLLADYQVVGDGIYLRNFNVRLATFAGNTTALRKHLEKIFNAAAKRAKANGVRS